MMFFSTLLALLPLSFAAPHELQKRQSFNGRATFYDVGLGACGGYNSAGDFIVALNSAQYGGGYPGPNCGRSLTISYGGKTATATVQDQCPGCGYGDLDFSRGLFNYFASESVGTFQMTWWWNNGNSSPQPSTTTTQAYVAPTTTQAPQPTTTVAPTTTTQAPPQTTQAHTTEAAQTTTTQQQQAQSSTTSNTQSTQSTTTTLSKSASGTATALVSASTTIPLVASMNVTAVPSGTGTPAVSGTPMGSGNWVYLNQAIANMGRVIVVSGALN